MGTARSQNGAPADEQQKLADVLIDCLGREGAIFACRVWQGAVTPREGQELAWVRPVRLADYPMPPADAPLVALLRDLL